MIETAVLLVVAAALSGVAFYLERRNARRDAAVLEDLIRANRARSRPGMERRDDRLLEAAGRRGRI